MPRETITACCEKISSQQVDDNVAGSLNTKPRSTSRISWVRDQTEREGRRTVRRSRAPGLLLARSAVSQNNERPLLILAGYRGAIARPSLPTHSRITRSAQGHFHCILMPLITATPHRITQCYAAGPSSVSNGIEAEEILTAQVQSTKTALSPAPGRYAACALDVIFYINTPRARFPRLRFRRGLSHLSLSVEGGRGSFFLYFLDYMYIQYDTHLMIFALSSSSSSSYLLFDFAEMKCCHRI